MLELTCDHNGTTPLVSLIRSAPMVTKVEEVGAYQFRITVEPPAPPPSITPPPMNEMDEADVSPLPDADDAYPYPNGNGASKSVRPASAATRTQLRSRINRG